MSDFKLVHELHCVGMMKVLLNHTDQKISFVFRHEHPSIERPDYHYNLSFDEFETVFAKYTEHKDRKTK